MKTYSTEEKGAARNALPRALSEFLDSPELKKTYADIREGLRLNLRQAGAFIEITEVTLSGLEPESDFARNIRAALPELSKENFDELIVRANSGIFSEARKRLRDAQTKS